MEYDLHAIALVKLRQGRQNDWSGGRLIERVCSIRYGHHIIIVRATPLERTVQACSHSDSRGIGYRACTRKCARGTVGAHGS